MRLRPVQAVLVTLAFGAAATATISAAITFTSTFKSLDAGSVSFAGKKVAALVVSNDTSLRVAGEESLVRELNSRGMQAVATYRIAPKEELQRAETARPWFERANVDGVVVVRPVSAETRQTYIPSLWVSPSYGTFWGYYGYSWSAVYVPGRAGCKPRQRSLSKPRSTACRAISSSGRPSAKRGTTRPGRVRRGAREGDGRADAEARAGQEPATIAVSPAGADACSRGQRDGALAGGAAAIGCERRWSG